MTNKKKALLFGCGPGTALIINFVLYGILKAIASTLPSTLSTAEGLGAQSTGHVIFSIIFVIQGFLGVVLLLLSIAGFIAAIIFLAQGDGQLPPPPAQPPAPPQQ